MHTGKGNHYEIGFPQDLMGLVQVGFRADPLKRKADNQPRHAPCEHEGSRGTNVGYTSVLSMSAINTSSC